MFQRFLLLVFALTATHSSLAVPFDTTCPPLFGVPRCVVTGVYWETEPPSSLLTTLQPSLLRVHSRSHKHSGGKQAENSNNDNERDEHERFHVIESVEESVIHALQDEVNLMFPHENSLQHHENEQHKTNKYASVKTQQPENNPRELRIRFEKEGHPFPYDLQGALDKEKKEHNISHAVQVAEKAVVHAIEEEVDTLFTNLPRHEKQPSSKATRPARKTIKPEEIQKEEHHYHSLEEFLEFTDE